MTNRLYCRRKYWCARKHIILFRIRNEPLGMLRTLKRGRLATEVQNSASVKRFLLQQVISIDLKDTAKKRRFLLSRNASVFFGPENVYGKWRPKNNYNKHHFTQTTSAYKMKLPTTSVLITDYACPYREYRIPQSSFRLNTLKWPPTLNVILVAYFTIEISPGQPE